MLDREKIVAVLKRRFPGAAAEQVAAATNAIIGLDDEWVEVPATTMESEGAASVLCEAACYLSEAARTGRLKVFKRVEDGES
jgi:hypothetical protein